MSSTSPEKRRFIDRLAVKVGPMAASVVAAIGLYLNQNPGLAIGALLIGAGVTGVINRTSK